MQIQFSEFSPPQLLPADGSIQDVHLAPVQRFNSAPAMTVERVIETPPGPGHALSFKDVTRTRPHINHPCRNGWTLVMVAGSRLAYLVERRPIPKVLDATYGAEVEVYGFRHEAKLPKSWTKKDYAIIREAAVAMLIAIEASRSQEGGPHTPLPVLSLSVARKGVAMG